jgi:cytoskeletal protein CcmA (bactofilin family)
MSSSPIAIQETSVNMVAEGTRIEGKVTFDQVSRVHGVLVGEVRAREGSTLILSETAVVEGSVEADTLMVDGYVHGDIDARTRVVVSRTGRVVGNIKTPSLTLEFGAYFEGRCSMENAITSGPSLRPA